MRKKIFKSLLLALVGVFGFTACSDDEPNISTTPIIKSVVTTEAEVTAYSATLKGTVDGLSGMSTSSFRVGALYSTDESNVKNGTDVSGSYDDGNISAVVSGLETGKVYYYQVYVTLQGRVSYYGEVKSFVTTDAKVSAASATATASKVSVAASVTGIDNVPVEVGSGIKVSTSSDEEAIKDGLNFTGEISNGKLSVDGAGLLPNTTYYYVPYISLGDGHVYGEVTSFKTSDFTIEYVDLGLSVLWATTNIGAEKASELGSYIAYGQLDPTVHATDIASYTVTGDIYGGANDIVSSLSDGRLPMADDFKELIACTTHSWTTVDGVAGIRFTASNGNSIFLPAAGQRYGQEISDVTSVGNYWLGQVDGSNNEFGRVAQFTSASAGLETVARNVAISARPVKKQALEFKKALLNNTWYIDLDAEGKSYMWDGPLYFYGSADCWKTISGDDVVAGDSWSWCCAWGDISSWIGFDAADFGSMTFAEDGSVEVVESDGTSSKGTYTIDEKNKTITVSGVSVLHTPGDYSNTTTDLHILSLTEQKLQICVVRSDGQHLSMNYINGERKEFYSTPTCTVSFCDWDGENGWPTVTQEIQVKPGESHTIAIEEPMVAGRVVVLDFIDLRAQYPHAFIKLDKIKLDGKEVSFDANKLKYGDLEGNGKYRIEIFNCYGAGTASDSPFGGGAKDSESALACNSKIELTYTIVNVKENQGENLLVAGLTTCDSNWNSAWPDASADLEFNGSVVGAQQSVTVEGERKNGFITLLELKNVLKYFPNIKLRLDEVVVDGVSVPFDADKILYGELEAGTNNYRIELFNHYGTTAGNLPDSNPWSSYEFIDDWAHTIPALGFKSSFEVKYTVLNLF